MRLFIAIDLPEDWKRLLAQPETSIGWLGRGVKWVDPHSTHLTLKFLGEVEEKMLPDIQAGMATACREVESFSMQLKGTGVFPNAKMPRVYWVGIDAPPNLMTLQARIEQEMETLGFEKEERAFKPHLTLARIKDPAGKQRMTEALLSYKIESGAVTVRETLLMRSHLSSEGARYEAMWRCPLGTPATS
ncbi:RNA 2',3'-cyclic phosphodiesterase [candidate division KSB1 bacterium]|nr:MAG: RNA 2',3'-cyclic phosphodiesterase [candidate division KSB1 bacterium]